MMTNKNIAILGSGAWGTAFGKVLVDAGNLVTIWGSRSEVCKNINDNNCLPNRLDGIELPADLRASTSIDRALNGQDGIVDVVVVAISAQKARGVLNSLMPDFLRIFGPDKEKWPIFLSLMKGLEVQTGSLMTQMISDELEIGDKHIAALAGPNLAKEVALRMPSSATIVSNDLKTAELVSELFGTSQYFEVEVSKDVVGVQMMSCLKNVYALLCGYYAGKGYGASTTGALVTNAIRECQRLLVALNADPQSVLGYAGIGDILATCTSNLSRNYSFGFLVGSGETQENAALQARGVVEGVATISTIMKLVDETGVNMPLVQQAAGIFSNI
ncbi:MAG: NAD(P)H-dependent glycerol-3-phosphate dehydrogenase [Candidatus Ancillula sp.]|jgi:glycerol-3-phosphate dehydrogenase (NAD(P)+)|nr:NAD(P)H-dependent glycerol-3-phosphate dehydrogenase [Candidatus Ancillula sp.]